MAVKLTKLPKTQYSGLDYQNIMEDIVTLVTENPEYSDQYDDFLSSNAGRTITELFAYIADQLATRIDWVANENFLGTATQKSSVIKILKLLGYNFDLPISSTVEVTAKANQPVGEFYLTEPYDNSGNITPYTLTAEDTNGAMRTFEAINYNEDNDSYDYKGGVKINTGSSQDPNLTHYVEFHEGITYIEEYVSTTNNNPIFTLSQSPVVENSIQVYLVSEEGGLVVEERLNQVNSFLDPLTQNQVNTFGEENPLTYKLNVLENDTVNIEFPPTTLVPDNNRRLRVDDRIRIFYRVGGGINGNITVRSINIDKSLSVNGNNVNIHFVNEQKGTGGRDGETAEYASVYAPLSIRTAEKAVTEEDYNIIVNSDNTVVKAKSFGNNNIAPSTVYSEYGMYIHPLEVWHFILRDKPGWEDIAPSRYKDFQWITLRLENRFNEILAFRDGEFDKEVLAFSSDLKWEENFEWNGSGEEELFNNYMIIDTPQKFKENIYKEEDFNSEFLFKLTNTEIDTYYFQDLALYNEFQEIDSTNNGLIEGSTPVWQISQIIPAKLKSEIDVSNGADLFSKYLLSLGFDNNPIITDIDLRGSNPSETTAQEIVDIINDSFTNDSNYNNGASGVKGYQELGLSVDSSTSAGLPDDTIYYLYVNGYNIYITTGTSSTYEDIKDLLQEGLSKTLYADINAQSTVITNVRYDIERVEVGMSISGDGIDPDTTITDVSIPDKSITISNAATLSLENEAITISGYEVTLEGTSPSEDIRITNIACYPKYSVRIESGLEGNDLLNALSTTVDAPNSGSGKSGLQELGLSVDLSTVSPLTDSTDYYFKINGYEYSITTTTDDTYNGIITLLDIVLDPNYTVEATGSTGTDDIRFINDTSGPVLLEAGVSGNDLFEGLLGEDYSLLTSIGGGDYSTVATTISETNRIYLQVKSPNRGEVSQIIFEQTSDSSKNALEKLFNISVGGEEPTERVMYGIKKLTVITNQSSDNFGNVIFENGSINFDKEQVNFYLNYLTDDKKTLDIGRYYNENFDEDDPSWRIVANRVYNTVYDLDRLTIDLNSSEFYIRMTKNNVRASSLFVIENDWNIDEATNAELETVVNPQDNIGSSNYYLSIQFDDKPEIYNIDITANEAASPSYTITEIVNNLNNAIRDASGYSDDLLYTNFAFASLNETNDRIIIKSPLNNNISRIKLLSSTVNDAVNELFGLSEGIEHTYYAQGDYFIDYDEVNDIMTFNKLITNTSNKIPDLPFYFHFIYDKRIEENIFDGEEGRAGFAFGTIDEDVYEDTLSGYKIVGLNHVYRETQFNTFDIKGTVYYNKIYSQEDIANRVEENLRNQFGLESIDFGEGIPKSKILSTIHESDGIEYVVLDFLGTDAQDESTNVENTIESKFNEIIVLSEDRFSSGQKIHGLIFDYIISG